MPLIGPQICISKVFLGALIIKNRIFISYRLNFFGPIAESKKITKCAIAAIDAPTANVVLKPRANLIIDAPIKHLSPTVAVVPKPQNRKEDSLQFTPERQFPLPLEYKDEILLQIDRGYHEE